jgi:hypothetical protein
VIVGLGSRVAAGVPSGAVEGTMVLAGPGVTSSTSPLLQATAAASDAVRSTSRTRTLRPRILATHVPPFNRS